MHSSPASVAVVLLARRVLSERPGLLPASIPDPLAYYFLDEGQGFALKDFISGNDDGRVVYDGGHQTVAYTEPNWTDDDFFGTAIQCGKKDTEQKDTLELADVGYGHTGAWSLSLWFRHDEDDFEGSEREQFVGHGDALQPTSSANQFHVQFELSKVIRTIVYQASTDTVAVPETHDTNWHQYVFTANPDYAEGGYFVYIDGVQKDAGLTTTGAFDPIGTIRLCGRLKPAAWEGGDDGATAWDAERYFLGKVAHFSVWDSAMTPDQVQALHAAYLTAAPGGTGGARSKSRSPILLGLIIVSAVACALLLVLAYVMWNRQAVKVVATPVAAVELVTVGDTPVGVAKAETGAAVTE